MWKYTKTGTNISCGLWRDSFTSHVNLAMNKDCWYLAVDVDFSVFGYDIKFAFFSCIRVFVLSFDWVILKKPKYLKQRQSFTISVSKLNQNFVLVKPSFYCFFAIPLGLLRFLRVVKLIFIPISFQKTSEAWRTSNFKTGELGHNCERECAYGFMVYARWRAQCCFNDS